MTATVLAVVLLSQGVADRTEVLELMSIIVEDARRDGAGQGANAGASVGLNLSSFVVLGSTASGRDFTAEEVRAALAFSFDDATPAKALRCDHPGAPPPRVCIVPWGIYLELNGLLVTPLGAEATVTMKWTTATLEGVPVLGLRTIRVRFKREAGTWVQAERTTLMQS